MRQTIQQILARLIETTYGPALAILGVAAMAGWISGTLTGADQQPPPPGSDRLTLPAWSSFAAGESRQQALAASQIFAANPDDTKAPAVAAPAEAPEDKPQEGWKFLGTALRSNRLVAVIALEGASTSVVVGPGDQLPNGGRVEDIAPDRLVFMENASQRELRLFERIEN